MTPAADVVDQETEIEIEVYPDWAHEDEQRRAYVLDCVGGAASELDAQMLGQMVVDLAEMLKTGTVPPKVRKLKPVM